MTEPGIGHGPTGLTLIIRLSGIAGGFLNHSRYRCILKSENKTNIWKELDLDEIQIQILTIAKHEIWTKSGFQIQIPYPNTPLDYLKFLSAMSDGTV